MADKKEIEKKDKFKEKYIECFGNITMTCKKLKMARRSFYAWCEKDIITDEDIKEWDSIIEDSVEEMFIDEDLKKHFKGRKFWLERKHKDYKQKGLLGDNVELKVGVIILPILKDKVGLDGTEQGYFKAKDGSFVATEHGTTDLCTPKAGV